jgi:hypothetical protein
MKFTGGITPFIFNFSSSDGGEWSDSSPHRIFCHRGNISGAHEIGAAWAPEPVWRQCRQEKSFASDGIRSTMYPLCSLFTVPTTSVLFMWLKFGTAQIIEW